MGTALLPGLNVSRETFERLREFEKLILKWTKKINLISSSTQDEIWHRHIIDSAQLQLHIGTEIKMHLDLGSGGGLPGVVIAILNAEGAPEWRTTLVESDQRKCAFLRQVARDLSLPLSVKNARIEAIELPKADLITARALADLSKLFSYTEPLFQNGGQALFQKGVGWKKEVDDAKKNWNFDYRCITSLTNSQSVILQIGGTLRVPN